MNFALNNGATNEMWKRVQVTFTDISSRSMHLAVERQI